jgi:hypothetical protein
MLFLIHFHVYFHVVFVCFVFAHSDLCCVFLFVFIFRFVFESIFLFYNRSYGCLLLCPGTDAGTGRHDPSFRPAFKTGSWGRWQNNAQVRVVCVRVDVRTLVLLLVLCSLHRSGKTFQNRCTSISSEDFDFHVFFDFRMVCFFVLLPLGG